MRTPDEIDAEPEHESIEIEYSITLDDHLDEMAELGARVYQLDRWTLLKKTWLTALAFAFAFLGFAWIVRWFSGSTPAHPDASTLVICGCLGVWMLYSFSSPSKQSKRMRGAIRNMNTATAGCYLGVTRLTLTSESIEYEDCYGTAAYTWESVYEMRQNERGFNLILANQRYIFVPSAADPERHASDFATRQVARHHCPNPAAAMVIGDAPAICPRCERDMSNNSSAVCPNCDCQLSLTEISKARCLGEAKIKARASLD